MNFSGKLVMNTEKVTARYAGNMAAAQRFLDSSVLKDSGTICPGAITKPSALWTAWDIDRLWTGTVYCAVCKNAVLSVPC